MENDNNTYKNQAITYNQSLTTDVDIEKWKSIFKDTGMTYVDSRTNAYPVPPLLHNIYSELAENFGLDLTEEQVKTLNDLFNSGDENNRVIAANMFKYLLFKDKEDEQK